MKPFIFWLWKKATTGIAVGTFALAAFAVAYAVSYPVDPPTGEVNGGRFMQYFNSIKNPCPAGQYLRGYDTSFTRVCASVPAGATGPAGPVGATGPQWPAGNNGSNGATGPQGASGPQGATGPQGSQWPAGSNGATGPQGPTWPQGPAGWGLASCSTGWPFYATYLHGRVTSYDACGGMYQCLNGTITQVVAGGSCAAPTCFPAGTKVLSASGDWKAIESIRPGDRVIGRNGSVNTVQGLRSPKLGDRTLYRFNGDFLSTADHMFLTPSGWGAVDPDFSSLRRYKKETTVTGAGGVKTTVILSGIPREKISKISIGTPLMTYEGTEKTLRSLDPMPGYSPDTLLYTLMVDGTADFAIQGGYVADGMPQHE